MTVVPGYFHRERRMGIQTGTSSTPCAQAPTCSRRTG